MSAATLRLVVATGTDRGRVRAGNEDAVFPPPGSYEYRWDEAALLAVADGMGGGPAGEEASQQAIAALAEEPGTETQDPEEWLRRAYERANDSILRIAQHDPLKRGLGTTLVAVVIHRGRATIANIGDSRCYVHRQNHLEPVTLDHSWVAEQVRAGLLTPREAAVHPWRHLITRVLGLSDVGPPDLFTVELAAGDALFLCTDGLTGVLSDPEITAELDARGEPAQAVDRLIELANAAGGPDNISVCLARLQAP